MNIREFLKTWEGTQAENRWLRIFIVGLLALLLLLGLRVLSKDTLVVLQPPTLNEEAWVTKSASSQSYQESWGLFLAQLVGNSTPSTVSFLKDRIGPLLDPSIYSDVIEAIELQANQIKNDRVSMRFEPRVVEYEPTTGKVFVQGYSFIKTVNGNEEKSDRTYEFIIKVSNYQPTVEFINTYGGRARTTKILQQAERREEVRKDREKRIQGN